jgi:hypothetical protein
MGKSAPQPTDPHETSAAQTGTNVSTAIANAWLGNINEYTPDGSTNFRRTGMQKMFDPYTGKTYQIPTFSRWQKLSPKNQAIYDQMLGAKGNMASLANQQSGFLKDYMAKPFHYDPTEHEKWATGLYDTLNNDKIAQNEEALRTRLSNQGLMPGSEAFQRQYEAMTKGNLDARNQFGLDSYNTGFNTALTERNQPINEITALLSGSQINQPRFMGANMPTIPTTDNAGIINAYDQNKMNARPVRDHGGACSPAWEASAVYSGYPMSAPRKTSTRSAKPIPASTSTPTATRASPIRRRSASASWRKKSRKRNRKPWRVLQVA